MLRIDDYIRMTQITFFKEKYETFEKFKSFKTLVENVTDLKIKCLRSDREGEFTSYEFDEFRDNHGTKRHFSVERTPQQNEIVEMKNIIVQEMDRTMLNEAKLPDTFWREAINTTIYILNMAQIRVNNKKTLYELWKGRLAIVKHFKVFGRKCYINRNEDNLGKFDSKTNEDIFLSYASGSKAYKCYNKILHKVLDNINVRVDETILQQEKLQTNEDLEET
jgi:hypothetical protein